MEFVYIVPCVLFSAAVDGDTVPDLILYDEHPQFFQLFAQLLDVEADDAVIQFHIGLVVEHPQRTIDVDFQCRGDTLRLPLFLLPQAVVQITERRHILRLRVVQILLVDQRQAAVNDRLFFRLHAIPCAHNQFAQGKNKVRFHTKRTVRCFELADKVIYTGPIDAYFDYKLGTLEYRSVRFENELLDKSNFQGNAAVNYTDRETPWTRIIEHKWFEFGKDENGNDIPKTIISKEYSSEWRPGDEPYYPVNDTKNSLLYSEYKKLADAENKVVFGGRLGEYKYYDMDQVIAAVLERCERELK